MFGALVRRLLSLLRRDRLARELEEEVRAHHDELRQGLEADGHAPEEAARLARLRLGGIQQIRESSQDEWRLGTLEGLAQDFRIAFRSLRRRPGFSTAAIATLALGIGASSAIFSVAYGVSLRPLPYPQSSQLVRIYESNPAAGRQKEDVSVGAFHDWRAGAPSIENAALFKKPATRTLAGPEGMRLTTMGVSPAFFDVLGIRLKLGSGFKPEREYTRFTLNDVILSYRVWQRLFDARPDVVGATLTLTGIGDDDTFSVVGVLPEDFEFIESVDLWMPTMLEASVAPKLRGWRYDRVIARLESGTSIAQARAELETVAARTAHDFPATSAGWTVNVESLHDSIVGNFGRATWLLLAAVAVVLLVACLNVGGLLVARAVARERETAVRAALGAGAWRIVRLWLAEASLVGVAGAAVGLLLAWSGVSALKAAAPPGLPRVDAIAVDLPTVMVAMTSTMLAIAIFTIAPRRQPADLRTSAAGAGEHAGRQRTRGVLTVAQCAGAATLVVLAVLLTRSFVRLMSFDLGWDARGVLSVHASPNMPRELRRPWFARVEWSDRLIARLEATPGVARAAVTTQLPLAPAPYASTLARGRGKSDGDAERWRGIQHQVTDGYFELMGIRLVSGRLFDARDRFTEAQMISSDQRPDAGAVIVTHRTALTLWPGESAIGRALWLPDIDTVKWREVIGVVEDIQFGAVGETPALHVFLPWTQESGGRIHVLAKAAGTATAIAATARDVVQTVEPGAKIDQIVSLDALVSRATAQPRFTSRVVAAFGALALALAGVGIYGTLSYLVGARTREIGIRLALGASRGAIQRRIIWGGLLPATVGGLAGLAVAVVIAQAFRAVLFEIEPLDFASFAGGATGLLLVALAATLGPARRASRVDPARALRVD